MSPFSSPGSSYPWEYSTINAPDYVNLTATAAVK